MPLALVGIYQFIGTRRSFIAVGGGWLFFRTEPWGGGWIRLEDLTMAELRTPNGGVAHLRRDDPSFRSRLVTTPASFDVPSELQHQVALQVLSHSPTMDEDAREVLDGWAHAAPRSL